MKALICAKCMDIRALPQGTEWITCRCENAKARWSDPNAGRMVVNAKDKQYVRVLGINNTFLLEALASPNLNNDSWRHLHDVATNAKGYVFDKEFRNCWACVFKVGETSDVSWEET